MLNILQWILDLINRGTVHSNIYQQYRVGKSPPWSRLAHLVHHQRRVQKSEVCCAAFANCRSERKESLASWSTCVALQKRRLDSTTGLNGPHLPSVPGGGTLVNDSHRGTLTYLAEPRAFFPISYSQPRRGTTTSVGSMAFFL